MKVWKGEDGKGSATRQVAALPSLPRAGQTWRNDVSELEDRRWMKKALRLAARGRGRTNPNPMVGAVVVKRGQAVGSGWHHAPGSPHAEILALLEAGDRAKGATLYVTLEPCVHQGRTPPCVDGVLRAGVSRVVAAVEDPDERVRGRGLAALHEAGVLAEHGLMSDEARRLNEAYFTHRSEGRPFVTYKTATSLDGKTAAADGTSKWISGEEARRDVHRIRGLSDAICAGIGTVLADDPRLTFRGSGSCEPVIRVVVDSACRTPLNARILSSEAPTIIATALEAPDPRVLRLQAAGAQVLSVPGVDGRVSLPAMLSELADRGVVSLLLEGGPTLAGAFVSEGLIDRFVVYVAPKLIGGNGAHGTLEGWAAESIHHALELRIDTIRRVGADLRVVAYPARAKRAPAGA